MTVLASLRQVARRTGGRPASVLLAAIAVHLAFAILHGVTQRLAQVQLADWQTGFVTAVLFLAPLVAIVALWLDRIRLAGWFVLLAGLAGLGFEALFHFLVANPDHVATVSTHQLSFAGTAALSTLADLVLALAGAWVLER